MFDWLKEYVKKQKKLKREWSKTQYCEDLPEKFVIKTVYIIGTKKHPWQAAFICPCGCGELIQLSLVPKSSPRWRFYRTKKGISLAPSIWRTTGCKSHFVLKNGKVNWVDEF